MATKKVSLDNLADEIIKAYSGYVNRVEKTQAVLIKTYADVLADEVSINTPRSRKKGKHLADGWKVTIEKVGAYEVKAYIHNTTKPGVVHLLELGTVRGVEPRPFVIPAFNKIAPKLEKALIDTIKNTN